MLVTLKQAAQLAEARGNALGAFNAPCFEGVRAVIQAAEESGEAVILQHAQMHEDIFPLADGGPLMLRMADSARVPVCVHLDHGVDLDYINRALKVGFTSVMFDGSGLDYAENKAKTAIAVELAAKTGASVEGEIGTLGTARPGHEDDMYTNPDDAVDFVKSTGIDALACAFGTVHGLYKSEPKLDFARVAKLHGLLDVPLVMHGGSGVSEEDYYKCIAAGIRKINYFTYAMRAGGIAIREKLATVETPYLHELTDCGRAGMKLDVLEAIRVFSLAGKTAPRAKSTAMNA